MRYKIFGYFYILLFISICISAGLISCKDSTDGPTKEIVFPASNVSYSLHVGPLFQQKCATACHSGATPPNGLNLSYPSYQTLRDWPSLISPGNSAASTLVMHLDGTLLPMPPSSFPQLTPNQKTGIKVWIDEGALNN